MAQLIYVVTCCKGIAWLNLSVLLHAVKELDGSTDLCCYAL